METIVQLQDFENGALAWCQGRMLPLASYVPLLLCLPTTMLQYIQSRQIIIESGYIYDGVWQPPEQYWQINSSFSLHLAFSYKPSPRNGDHTYVMLYPVAEDAGEWVQQ